MLVRFAILFLPLLLVGLPAGAGPYSPAAGQAGSTAIGATDARIIGWASGVSAYQPGPSVDPMWRDQAQALGPAEGDSFTVVSLGQSGRITLTFDEPIADNDGPDFAVFENAFNDSFLELAFVEVSSDGETFVRFPVRSLTTGGVGTYGSLDSTNLDGFAGTFRQGFGTPFDLADLSQTATFNPDAVTHVRLIDLVGNGLTRDPTGQQIFDPYPTTGSAGFDLDGIAVLGGSAPDILGFAEIGSGFEVRFNSTIGVNYSLEYVRDLTEGWQLYGPPVNGSGSVRGIFVHKTFSALALRLRRELGVVD